MKVRDEKQKKSCQSLSDHFKKILAVFILKQLRMEGTHCG
jgi:hypothetical protein